MSGRRRMRPAALPAALQMCHAVRAGAELPPISVYRLGDVHYVRDGHHRVSVARALGADHIDADVTELVSAAR